MQKVRVNRTFRISYEGGDSEFFNYLAITITIKCEKYVFKIFRNNKKHITIKI